MLSLTKKKNKFWIFTNKEIRFVVIGLKIDENSKFLFSWKQVLKSLYFHAVEEKNENDLR